MNEEYQPKISLPEILLIGFFFVLIDTIEVIIAFAALDDFWILDILAASIFFYLLIKGVPPIRQLVCWILELIPWIGALPLLTIGWVATVWADRHPSGALAKAGALVGTVEGKGAFKAGAAKAKGAGAQSLRRMERAEKRSAEWKTKLSPGTRPSQKLKPGEEEPKTSAARGKSPKEAAESRTPEDAEREEKEKISKEAFGEKPTPFEQLGKLTKETPQEEKLGDEEEEEKYDVAA